MAGSPVDWDALPQRGRTSSLETMSDVDITERYAQQWQWQRDEIQSLKDALSLSEATEGALREEVHALREHWHDEVQLLEDGIDKLATANEHLEAELLKTSEKLAASASASNPFKDGSSFKKRELESALVRELVRKLALEEKGHCETRREVSALLTELSQVTDDYSLELSKVRSEVLKSESERKRLANELMGANAMSASFHKRLADFRSHNGELQKQLAALLSDVNAKSRRRSSGVVPAFAAMQSPLPTAFASQSIEWEVGSCMSYDIQATTDALSDIEDDFETDDEMKEPMPLPPKIEDDFEMDDEMKEPMPLPPKISIGKVHAIGGRSQLSSLSLLSQSSTASLVSEHFSRLKKRKRSLAEPKTGALSIDVRDVMKEYLFLTATAVRLKYPSLSEALSAEELIGRAKHLPFYQFHDAMEAAFTAARRSKEIVQKRKALTLKPKRKVRKKTKKRLVLHRRADGCSEPLPRGRKRSTAAFGARQRRLTPPRLSDAPPPPSRRRLLGELGRARSRSLSLSLSPAPIGSRRTAAVPRAGTPLAASRARRSSIFRKQSVSDSSDDDAFDDTASLNFEEILAAYYQQNEA